MEFLTCANNSIHGNSKRNSPQKHIQAQWVRLGAATADVAQKETLVTASINALKNATSNSVNNALSAWSWAWQNIVTAHYNAAKAEIELETIKSKLKKLQN